MAGLARILNRHADRRAVTAAVVASIAFHAVLLFGLPAWRPAPAPAAVPPLIARIRVLPPPPPPAPPVPPAPPAPEVVKPQPAPVAKPVVKPKPRPKPRPKPKPKPKPKVVEASRPKPAAKPAAEPPGVRAAPPPPVLSQAKPQAAPAPAAPVVSEADLIAGYRDEVARVAETYKRYPRVARDNDWHGAAELRMTVGADGAIRSLEVVKSAGYAVLDRQALEMFRQAQPRVQVPAALRGKSFSFVVRAVYSLRER